MPRIKCLVVVFCFVGCLGAAHAQSDNPNILVIWGDDVGITNISAYSHGLMGYQTPNIDRIANEEPLDRTLDDLCRMVEALVPDSICSLMRC